MSEGGFDVVTRGTWRQTQEVSALHAPARIAGGGAASVVLGAFVSYLLGSVEEGFAGTVFLWTWLLGVPAIAAASAFVPRARWYGLGLLLGHPFGFVALIAVMLSS